MTTLSKELKKYLVSNKIEPVHIEVQSRSGAKEAVECCYFKHPIEGDEYRTLAALIKGTWSSCAMGVNTVLLIPSKDLGPTISIIDAISTAESHKSGKAVKRVVDTAGPSLKELKAEIAKEKKVAAAKKKKATEEEDVVEKKEAKKPAAKKKAAAKKKPAGKKQTGEDLDNSEKVPEKPKPRAKAKAKAATKRKSLITKTDVKRDS